MKKITIRIDDEELKKIKIELLKRDEKSFQDFAMKLIRKELFEKSIKKEDNH